VLIMVASGNLIYTGCMKPEDIGELVYLLHNEGYRFCEGDFTRFDGHNEIEAIEAEYEYYEECFDPDMLQLLKMQQHYRGTTSNRFEYSCHGKVCSGVCNTSLGNTLRVFMIVINYLYGKDIEWKLIVVGDDNIVCFKDGIDSFDLRSLIGCAERMGHRLIAKIVDDIDMLEYCSSRFWDIGATRILGPKIGRFLAKGFVCKEVLRADKILDHMRSVGACYKYYKFLPGIAEVLESLDCFSVERNKFEENPYKLLLNRSYDDINYQAIDNMFFKVYGIEARLFRELCASIDWKIHGKVYIHPYFDQIMQVDGAMKISNWVGFY